MGNIFLKNILLGDRRVDILVADGLISSIVPSSSESPCPAASGVETVDCSGKAVLPGFVNMHTHAAMSMMRGVGEDIAFHQWLDRIWKVESRIDEQYVYQATRLACLEMIKSGTTTFNDHYWMMPQARKAALEMGLSPALSYVLCDRNDAEEAAMQRAECTAQYEQSLTWPEKSQFMVAVHAIYSVCEPSIIWASEFAAKHGLKIHIHVSETRKEVEDCKALHGGLSPVEYLDSLGFLGPDVIAAHTLWLSDKDIEILGRRGVNCVHNVNSNLKLCSGYRFMYNELRDAGANVCLGTDGCASSNNLDMLETMKTSAMIQKAWRSDPTAMPLDELLAMATANAGKALGNGVGVVKEGAPADLMIVDTDNLHFISPASFLANFIYSAHSDCIDSLICKGRFVMRNRVVAGEKEIISEAKKVLGTIL
ncbi:MAG: amidohydrolase [Candidatus Cryptobacteroides sp.]